MKSHECRKVKWYTRNDAEGQVLRMLSQVGFVDDGHLNAYWCSQCGYWHVGNRDRRRL